MKPRVYISNDTFSALVAFLQKGIDANLKFFIYDTQNLIQNRLWTFSSTAFLPNVKSGDAILQNHQVPIVIATNEGDKSLKDYETIFYECSVNSYKDLQNISAIFMKSKEEVKKALIVCNAEEQHCDIYYKGEKKWEKITSLQP